MRNAWMAPHGLERGGNHAPHGRACEKHVVRVVRSFPRPPKTPGGKGGVASFTEARGGAQPLLRSHPDAGRIAGRYGDAAVNSVAPMNPYIPNKRFGTF